MENNNERPDDLLSAEQAAEYLRRKWGLTSWGVDEFRQYRYRLRKANKRKKMEVPGSLPKMPNSTMWRRYELDALPRLDDSKRRQQNSRDSLDVAEDSMLSYA